MDLNVSPTILQDFFWKKRGIVLREVNVQIGRVEVPNDVLLIKTIVNRSIIHLIRIRLKMDVSRLSEHNKL